MKRKVILSGKLFWYPLLVVIAGCLGQIQSDAQSPLRTAGQPAELDIRAAGEHSIRVTLKPQSFTRDFPFSPALSGRQYPKPALQIRQLSGTVKKQIGALVVTVSPDPLTIKVSNKAGEPIQTLRFKGDGSMTFQLDDAPVLGMGEGGPKPQRNTDWRSLPAQFDRRGSLQKMQPRWQGDAYGSRNPVAMMVGTRGWGLFVVEPWGQVDLRGKSEGIYSPVKATQENRVPQTQRNQQQNLAKGIPPVDSMVPGLYDLFVFDAHDPRVFMKEVSVITGPAILPPKWALGYMQSFRTLNDDNHMLGIIHTFREKKLPVDAVIYLGTGFVPRGWNTPQPSLTFNPEVFQHMTPRQFIDSAHAADVKVVVHIVPWDRNKLPSLHGSIPPRPGEVLDSGHIFNYWKQHIPLVKDGVDAFWPDEGDWFNLFERMERHKMYYQGPVYTQPDVRPWDLQRNGYLGIAKWGGWIWSGDTQSSWATLKTQIAVGLNSSLSLSPYWGSDIGGFSPSSELTGELYARWFQFAAFCPSFRSHGRTWWTRLPWGWGLSDMGPLEAGVDEPLMSEMNNPKIEPICRTYDELRYQLLPYNYNLAWEARTTGMPFMRALWLEFPGDTVARGLGSEYMWGKDLLIAPVFAKGVSSWPVYLPRGLWYDWWTNDRVSGGKTVSRKVDLSVMPIYVRAGAIIPFAPVRQYTAQKVDEPLNIRIYTGADGTYVFYQDDGQSLDYLHGAASWTRINWDDAKKSVTIAPAPPEGMTDGISSAQKLTLELLPSGVRKTVDYSGKKISVHF